MTFTKLNEIINMDRFWTEHLKRLCDSLIAQTDRARVGSDHSVIKGTSIEYVIRRTLTDYMPSNRYPCL